jgi:hypothetical protein
MRRLAILFLCAPVAYAAIELSLRINGGAPAVRGWPMLIEVIPVSPDAAGEWTDGVSLAERDPEGKAIPWPLEKLLTVPGSLIYRLTPEQTATVPEGLYEVRAALAGDADAVLEIAITAEPESPTREQIEQKTSVLANYRFLTGDTAGARVAVDELLKRHPDSITGLLLKGDLAADLRADEEAARAYADALALLPASHPVPHMLLRRYYELLDRLLDWQ